MQQQQKQNSFVLKEVLKDSLGWKEFTDGTHSSFSLPLDEKLLSTLVHFCY